MDYREFHNTARSGATRVWRIAVEGSQIYTEFGQLGGKMQEVVDVGKAKNLGKSNEVSAEQDALNIAERTILSKTRKGYRETGEQGRMELNPYDLPECDPLPENLCFYKPYNSLSSRMTALLKAGQAWLVRKYDGEMMVVQKTMAGKCKMYSRRMLRTHHLETDIPWEERFPQIVMEIEGNSNIPNGTVLLGEMIAAAGEEDDRWAVAQILKSKCRKALRLQETSGWLRFVIWDVAWADGGILLGQMAYKSRRGEASYYVDNTEGDYLLLPDILDPIWPIEAIQEDIETLGWEGLVAIDPEATYGDKGFNLRGKAERPRTACCKIKPVYEDDFVAMWDPENGIGKYGNGKYRGMLGAVELYQRNSSGEMTYICSCGNGWSKEYIAQNSTLDCWPKVIQVKYESRTYKSKGGDTDALQFPRFVQERTDKSEEECLNPDL